MSSLACTPLGVDELSFWWWKGTGSSLRSWKANTLWISIYKTQPNHIILVYWLHQLHYHLSQSRERKKYFCQKDDTFWSGWVQLSLLQLNVCKDCIVSMQIWNNGWFLNKSKVTGGAIIESTWRAMSWRVMEPLKSLNSLWRSSWHFSMYCWNSWPQIYPCNMRMVSLNFHLHQISGVFEPWPTCLPYAPRTLTIDTWGTWQSLPFVYGEAGHLVIHRKAPQNFHTRAFLEQSSAEPLWNTVLELRLAQLTSSATFICTEHYVEDLSLFDPSDLTLPHYKASRKL